MSREISIHPAAEISPPLEGAAFEALCDLLDRYGDIDQLDPILGVRVPEADGTLNGKVQILSGRSKLAACEKLGIEPNIHLYEPRKGKDGSLAELAASINILRRHLDASQRAAAGVAIEEQFAVEAKNRQKAAGGDRKSLLVKIPKAILGKSLLQTEEAIRELLAAEKDELFRQILPGESWKSGSIERLARIIFYHPSNESEHQESEDAIHARDRAAKICAVSPTYIGRAKIVAQSDQKLFLQVMRGQASLAQAFSEVRRQAKRSQLAAATGGGAFEKPRDNKGLDGIRQGDCAKILPTLPRQRVRLAIVDPPYNIGVDYGNGSKCDRLPDAEYLGRHERWIKQIPELLTPDGAVWVVINNEYAAEFVIMLKRAGLKMRAWIKWYETFGTNCSNNFNRTSRHLLYFVRDPKPGRFVFNAEPIRRLSARTLVYKDKRKSIDGMKIWDDVWDIPRVNGTSLERLPDFPTQLPIALIRPIVESCSDEGDLVLDPMCGSATVPVVCKMTGRQCLGIELNPEFAAMGRARLTKTQGAMR